MWDFFESVINLFQVIIIIETLTKYLGIKHNNLKYYTISAFFVILLFFELNYINKKTYFEGLIIIIPIIIIFLYAIIALNGDWKKKLYCSILIMIFVIGVTSIILNIISFFSGYSYLNLIKKQNAVRFIALIIIQMTIFYATRIFINNRKEDYGKLSSDIWIITIIIPIIFIITLSFILEITVYISQTAQIMAICASIGIFLSNILIYIIYIKMKKEENRKIEYELLKQKYIIQEQDISDIKELYSHLQKMKHDIKHHINLIKLLMENQEYNKALDYLNKYSISGDIGKHDKVFCNNTIINYIINSKITLIKANNIQFYCNISENITNVSDVDLNIILSNMFDNAIEACEKVSGKKEILLNISNKNSYLIIILKNSTKYIQKDLNNIKTSKKNKNEHGFGILCIKEVAAKYNGRVKIENEDNSFVMSVILDTYTE